MAFASMTAQLNLNISNFASQLAKAGSQMNSFSEQLNKNYKANNVELRKHSLGLKDTARIVQGIMISQAFYGIAQSIRSATSELWNFNKELDYSQVTYSALFGSTEVSSDFLSYLRHYAEETIFTFEDLTTSAKKLLAYGIPYRNIGYITEGLTALGTISGDTAALDRIALALGQIYTKGKLSAEEMRQLANAYVPITDIITQKFGLTEDQLESVGDLNLPAEDVINAIVDYANSTYGTAADAAMLTITGLENKIAEVMKNIGSDILKPITTLYKSFLAYIAGGLESIRSAFASGGLGGIFEQLVPDPNTQMVIRQFIANVQNLLMTLASILKVVGQVVKEFGYTFMVTFNALVPIILPVINAIAAVLNAMMQTSAGATVLRVALLTAAAAFVVLRMQALYATVVGAVTKVINGLSKSLLILGGIIARHPILAILAAIGVALVGTALASDGANKSISGLFDNLSKKSGKNSEDVLQKIPQDIKSGADAAALFNNRLDEGKNSADALKEAINGTGKAAQDTAKKASGLLSFDEVFKLNEPSDNSTTSGDGLLDALDDLNANIAGFGDDLFDDLDIEIPDFSDFADEFTDNLFGGLSGAFTDKLAKAGLGALIGGGIGAVIGGLIGGPAGAALGLKIGAFAGGFVGLFWDKITEAFEKYDTTPISAIFGAGVGGMIGFILGGPVGAALGAAIGTLAKTLTDRIWTALADAFNKDEGTVTRASTASAIGAGIGTAIGFVLGGPGGAAIGAAIGLLVAGIGSLFWEEIKAFFLKPDTMFGGIIGAAIGTAFGPVGTAIGAVVGAILGYFWEDLSAGFSEWWNSTVLGFVGWWEETKLGFLSWCGEVGRSLFDWGSETRGNFSAWWSETKRGFSTWWADTKLGFAGWVSNTLSGFINWASGSGGTLRGWWAETKLGFSDWWNNTRSGLSNWWSNTAQGFSNWRSNTLSGLSTWWSETKQKFNQWVSDVDKKLGEFFKLDVSFSTFCKNSLKSIVDWASEVWNTIRDKFNNAIAKIKEFLGASSEASNAPAPKVYSAPATQTSSTQTTRTTRTPVKSGNGWVSYDGVTRVSVGHAAGGIFNREHIARFAEGNKAEAVIPLENASAMQPFVNAISQGILEGLAPTLVQTGSGSDLPPMYVGTLIADERGIKQLYKKFEVIRVQENARKGLTT